MVSSFAAAVTGGQPSRSAMYASWHSSTPAILPSLDLSQMLA